MIVHRTPSSMGHRASAVGEPVWDMATLFPPQGMWTVQDYLSLDTNRLVEFTGGCIEVLPMPTITHQLIVAFLHSLLQQVLRDSIGGLVLFAPLPVRFRPDLYREPDIIYLRSDRVVQMGSAKYPDGADLVMEVVSEGQNSRERDYQQKSAVYAECGVSEYWIIDPESRTITVLVLDQTGHRYRQHGVFGPAQQASSVLVPGFTVAVSEVLAVGESKTPGTVI